LHGLVNGGFGEIEVLHCRGVCPRRRSHTERFVCCPRSPTAPGTETLRGHSLWRPGARTVARRVSAWARRRPPGLQKSRVVAPLSAVWPARGGYLHIGGCDIGYAQPMPRLPLTPTMSRKFGALFAVVCRRRQ
jgi:hypothetical protein